MAGALAGHIFESHTVPIEFGEAIGGGADGNTRGRVCSPNRNRPFVTRGSGGRDLAKAMAKTELSDGEAKAWRRDLRIARKILKPPADKWRCWKMFSELHQVQVFADFK